MVNKTISLTEETFDRLKTEDNASALIERLLKEYYQYNITNPEEINKRIQKLKEKKNLKNGELDKEIQKLQKIQNSIDTEKREKEKIKEKELNLKREERNNFFKNYKDLTNQEATEELWKEFKRRWDSPKEIGFSIFKFCDEKQKCKEQAKAK